MKGAGKDGIESKGDTNALSLFIHMNPTFTSLVAWKAALDHMLIFILTKNTCDDKEGTPVDPDSEKKQLALFLLKSVTFLKLSELALDNLIQDITVLLEGKVKKLRESLTEVVSRKGIQIDDSITSIFQDHRLITPFQGLRTEYCRKRYYREKMACIVSILLQ